MQRRLELFAQLASGSRVLRSGRPVSARRISPGFFAILTMAAFGLIALAGIAGCSSNVAKTSSGTPVISLAMTQVPPTSLIVGTTAQISATVTNDTAEAGVDWVATCGSAPQCGTFSPPHTPSGGTTTFTAPLAVPARSTVAVTALSATDRSKSFSTSVTVLSTVTGITITQLPPASAPAGALITLAATVTGDPANVGVDWRANCGGVDCTPTNWHQAAGGTVVFQVPGTTLVPNIVGSTVVFTAFAAADHNFSATASFTVTAPISVSITQAPPSSMLTNATASLIAVVSNDTTNAGVTWSVTCANLPCGSISPLQTASGAAAVFTAPPAVPAPNPNPNPVVTITAFSTAAGPGVSSSAEITIVAPISVNITQAIPTNSIVVNDNAPLVAEVNDDATNAGVNWTVDCSSAGACGSFSPAHTNSGTATTYTAPSAVPSGGTVTITATSSADPSKTATLTVTVTAGKPPNSLLLGQFVILVTARNSSNGPYTFGGVISGDGNGNITGGNLDLADASGNASTSLPVLPTSTYSIGADGRGQIQLFINTIALGASFGVNGSGAMTLAVVFVNSQHALLTETDSFGTGTGTLDLQNVADLASFQQGGWVSGTYSLRLSGSEVASPNPGYFVAGALTIDLSAGSYTYVADQSDNGRITSAPAASVSPNLAATRDGITGKLTFSPVNLGLPTNFSLDIWMIDATHFVVTDWWDSAFGTPPVIVGGYLTAQPTSASLSGTYAFVEAGADAAGQPQVAGGILTCGSAGTLDIVPLAGAVLSNLPITANCSASAAGRTVITISGASTAGITQFAAYPTLDQGLYLIELDGGSSGTAGPSGRGVALQQTLTTPITAPALNGPYASGFAATTALGSETFAGQLVSDGTATLTGTVDVTSLDASTVPPATPSPGSTLVGSYNSADSGRFPLTLSLTPASTQPSPQITSLNPACYIVDANTCLLLGLDAAAPGTGILIRQNTGL